MFYATPDHWIQLTLKEQVLKSPDCPPVVRFALVYSSHCSGFGSGVDGFLVRFLDLEPKKEELDDGKLRPIKQSHLPMLVYSRMYGGIVGGILRIHEIFSIIWYKLETTPTNSGVFGPLVSGP